MSRFLRIHLFAYLLFALLPLACEPDNLQDPASLERQLIIVWVALERGDTTVQRTYVNRARRSWRRLRDSYRTGSLDMDERGALILVDFWMLGLSAAVENGQQADALAHLRKVHRALGEVRLRRGGVHPVDLLYSFRSDWQWVTEISEDQMLCLLDWQEYAEAYRGALDDWKIYQTFPPTYAGGVLPGLHRYSGRAEAAARALSDRLVAFEQDLLAADHAPMGRAARAVHDQFITYLSIAVDYPLGVPQS